MRKILLSTKILVFLIISANLLLAGVTLQYFAAKPMGDGILIEWRTGDESGTAKIEIERSASAPDNFSFIKSVNATGNNSYYSFLDNSLSGFARSSGTIYYYRLKFFNSNGTYTYSNSISVVHSISGIKNTWGSIKAIFR